MFRYFVYFSFNRFICQWLVVQGDTIPAWQITYWYVERQYKIKLALKDPETNKYVNVKKNRTHKFGKTFEDMTRLE